MTKGFIYEVACSIGWLLWVLFTLTSCSQRAENPITHFHGSTMGTTYSVQMVGVTSDQVKNHIQTAITARLEKINALMSTWQEDSELSKFNRAPIGTWFPLSRETFQVLQLSLQISDFTNGSFDATAGPLVNLWGFGPDTSTQSIPSEAQIKQTLSRVGYHNIVLNIDKLAAKKKVDVYLDFSAVAKGYAVDVIADYLASNHYPNYLVEIGGELRGSGVKPDGTIWRVAIESPLTVDRQAFQGIEVSNMGVATSGDYRNYFEVNKHHYSHTLDPTTGRPVTHPLASVTVLDPITARADALATALMVKGPEKGFEFAQRHEIPAYFIVRSETGFSARATTSFRTYMILNE